MDDALKKLNENIEFVKISIESSEDEEEKTGLENVLGSYKTLKSKLEEINSRENSVSP